LPRSEQEKKEDLERLSLTLNLIPGINIGKAAIELAIQQDVITGREFTFLDNIFTIAGLGLDAFGFVKFGNKLVVTKGDDAFEVIQGGKTQVDNLTLRAVGGQVDEFLDNYKVINIKNSQGEVFDVAVQENSLDAFINKVRKQYGDDAIEILSEDEAALIIGGGKGPKVPFELNNLDKLDPADAIAVEDKFKSLGFFSGKPKKIKQLATTLTRVKGGEEIGDYILSGNFDLVEGYQALISKAQVGSELPSVYATLNRGDILIAEGKNIFFEKSSNVDVIIDGVTETKNYDIDLAVGLKSDSSTWSQIYQIKYVKGLNRVSKNVTEAAEQLQDAPAPSTAERWVEIRVNDGTLEMFKDQGKEKAIRETLAGKYPRIKARIIFSDGTEAVYP